jgi:hypothetical protein
MTFRIESLCYLTRSLHYIIHIERPFPVFRRSQRKTGMPLPLCASAPLASPRAGVRFFFSLKDTFFSVFLTSGTEPERCFLLHRINYRICTLCYLSRALHYIIHTERPFPVFRRSQRKTGMPLPLCDSAPLASPRAGVRFFFSSIPWAASVWFAIVREPNMPYPSAFSSAWVE